MIPESKWYVLYVKTGLENDIAAELNRRGFNTSVPIENRVIRQKGNWITQSYVVFSGYVFVYMNYTWNKYYAMSNIAGVIKLLGGGREPTPLSKPEVDFILSLTDMLAKPSVIRFTDSDSCEIVSGFLLKHRNDIIKIKRRNKKATVKITVAGEEKEITVSFTEEQTSEQTAD